jgi:hypothetical protein
VIICPAGFQRQLSTIGDKKRVSMAIGYVSLKTVCGKGSVRFCERKKSKASRNVHGCKCALYCIFNLKGFYLTTLKKNQQEAHGKCRLLYQHFHVGKQKRNATT